MNNRSLIYQLISATFCVIVLLSNILSAKFIQTPYLSISLPIGLLFYPLTFFLAQLIIEFYGAKHAEETIYVTGAMNLVCFALIQIALLLPGNSPIEDVAFQAVLGLSGTRIFASLTAYLVAQLLNVKLYSYFPYVWTLYFSLFVDTCLVDLLYLYGGLGMDWFEIIPIIGLSYCYKAFIMLTLTPLFYLRYSRKILKYCLE